MKSMRAITLELLLVTGLTVMGCSSEMSDRGDTGWTRFLRARTRRPWKTGTGLATPIGEPRMAPSWPTKARVAIWSRRIRTRISRFAPSSGRTTPPIAGFFSAFPIPQPSDPKTLTRRISTISARGRNTVPGSDRRCLQGVSDPEGGRQMEYL